MPYHTVFDDRAKTTIEKNPAAQATIERNILLLVAVDDEILHSRAFQMVTADHGKDCRGLGFVRHHAIGIQRFVDGEGVAVLSGNTGHSGVEASRLPVPNGDA